MIILYYFCVTTDMTVLKGKRTIRYNCHAFVFQNNDKGAKPSKNSALKCIKLMPKWKRTGVENNSSVVVVYVCFMFKVMTWAGTCANIAYGVYVSMQNKKNSRDLYFLIKSQSV